MYRAGQIIGPDDPATSKPGCRKIDAQLGDLVTGRRPGRRQDSDIILVNPFGLAIEDVAVAARVYQVARQRGLGHYLER